MNNDFKPYMITVKIISNGYVFFENYSWDIRILYFDFLYVLQHVISFIQQLILQYSKLLIKMKHTRFYDSKQCNMQIHKGVKEEICSFKEFWVEIVIFSKNVQMAQGVIKQNTHFSNLLKYCCIVEKKLSLVCILDTFMLHRST